MSLGRRFLLSLILFIDVLANLASTITQEKEVIITIRNEETTLSLSGIDIITDKLLVPRAHLHSFLFGSLHSKASNQEPSLHQIRLASNFLL